MGEENHHSYITTDLKGMVFCMYCREWKDAEDVDRVEKDRPTVKRGYAAFDCRKCGERQTSIVV